MRYSQFQGVPNSAAPHVGPAAITSASQSLATINGTALDNNTVFVTIKVETADIRITVNGTTPTTTKGKLYSPGDEVLLSREEADNALLIRAGATDGAVQISQYRF
jgi:hypothetical protein